jgi:hypothetical protein
VVGDFGQVRSALDLAHRDGRLAGVRDLVELPGHRIRVTADLRELVPTWRRVPWLRLLAWLLALAALGGAVWLVVLAVSAVISLVTAAVAWVSAHMTLIVICAVGLGVLLASVGSRCAGLHCGGCRQ